MWLLKWHDGTGGTACHAGHAQGKTKLVKLLYLVDVETWRLERRLLTSLDWRFYHYGPYAFALEPVLNRLEGQQVEWKEFAPDQLEKTILYTKVWQAPSGDRWPMMTKLRVDKIVDRWADEELELLLDHRAPPVRGSASAGARQRGSAQAPA